MASPNNSLSATHCVPGMCEAFLPRETRGALCGVWMEAGSSERNGRWLSHFKSQLIWVKIKNNWGKDPFSIIVNLN